MGKLEAPVEVSLKTHRGITC